MSSSASDAAQPPARSAGSRGWIWFFATLTVLTLLAIAINWRFNVSQQLKREHFDAARADWSRKAPPDYDLEYVKSGSVEGTYTIQVRGGKVVSAVLDGRVLERRLYSTCDMNALFDDIERFIELDSESQSPRTYKVATFDVQDGHLLRFIRSVTATRQRVEIRVNHLTRVAPGKPPTDS